MGETLCCVKFVLNANCYMTQKNMKKTVLLLATLLSSFAATSSLRAQVTAMIYQGNLNTGSAPANGSFDLTFTLYDSTNVPGNVIAGPLTNAATAVSNGLFTVMLDFGSGPFNGSPCWLEIGARTNGSGAFITLAPRQPIASTPYAVQALNAGNAASYTGGITDAQLSTNIARLNDGNAFTGPVNLASDLNVAGTMNGNGAGLTNVPLGALQQGGATSGQILSNNGVAWVPADSPNGGGGAQLNGTNTWTGTNTFTNTAIFDGGMLRLIENDSVATNAFAFDIFPGGLLAGMTDSNGIPTMTNLLMGTNGSIIWGTNAFNQSSLDPFGGLHIGGTNSVGAGNAVIESNLTVNGSITGDGSGLSNLNASCLAGTFSSAQLPSGVALLGANQTFTAPVNLASDLNVAGAMNGNGAGLTNVPLGALQQGGATSGQILSNNGAAWVPADSPNGGALLGANNVWGGVNTFTNTSIFELGDIFVGTNGGLDLSWDAPWGAQFLIYNGRTASNQVIPFAVYGPYRYGTNEGTPRSRVQITWDQGLWDNAYMVVDGDERVAGITDSQNGMFTIGQDVTRGMVLFHYYPYDKSFEIFTSPDGSGDPTNADYPNGMETFEIQPNGFTTIWKRGAADLGSMFQLIENDYIATNSFGFDVVSNGLLIGPVVGSGTNATHTNTSVFLGTNGNLTVNGAIFGDGSGLTNLNASSLTGAISSAQLPSGVAFLGTNQIFTGAIIFSNAANSFTGDGSGLANLNASSLTGLIAQAQFGTNVDFTSTIGDGTHNFANIVSHAHYTAVGGLVFVEIALTWSGGHNGANESSPVVISLPVAVTASYRATFTLAWVNGINFSRQLTAGASMNSAAIQIFDLNPGGAPNTLLVSNCAASGEIQLSGVFRAY